MFCARQAEKAPLGRGRQKVVGSKHHFCLLVRTIVAAGLPQEPKGTNRR